MIETKKTKQFYSINNAVATNTTNIKRMEYNFNNSTLTNIQTSSGQKCIFTPISVTLDWDYKNISESLKITDCLLISALRVIQTQFLKLLIIHILHFRYASI